MHVGRHQGHFECQRSDWKNDEATRRRPRDCQVKCWTGPASAVACLPCADDAFDLRLATTEIRADGVTPVAVLAIGTDPAGNPSSATVVLVLSRDDAGSLADELLTLTPLGALTEFVPCDAAESGCVGDFSLGLHYPGEPTEIIVSAGGVLVAGAE